MLAAAARVRAAWGSVRGFLGEGYVVTAEGRRVELKGDAECEAVTKDERLRGEDFEALGQMGEAGRFEMAPVNERGLFVWKKGKKRLVTYWCEICAIRAWAPGPCQCCQQETKLDLRDPGLKDSDPTP